MLRLLKASLGDLAPPLFGTRLLAVLRDADARRDADAERMLAVKGCRDLERRELGGI